jgi:hypothetical protein
MASQLAIEITLETTAGCIVSFSSGGPGTPVAPGDYSVTNVNLIPEILEFDASYDASFLAGLRDGGVPIKFSSWHTYQFGGGQSNYNLQIQERSRSVKSLFAVQRLFPNTIATDSGACFFTSTTASSLIQYQFRIGGRYFPASPVQCCQAAFSSNSNGGAEAYVELQKCLNTVGDYRLSAGVNTLRWAPTGTLVTSTYGAGANHLNNLDYLDDFAAYGAGGEIINSGAHTTSGSLNTASDIGSACFAAATNLETTNGIDISGLNAEEQSDISFLATYSAAQSSSCIMEVYSYYDAMIILRENNVLELIQ